MAYYSAIHGQFFTLLSSLPPSLSITSSGKWIPFHTTGFGTFANKVGSEQMLKILVSPPPHIPCVWMEDQGGAEASTKTLNSAGLTWKACLPFTLLLRILIEGQLLGYL